MEKPTDPPFLKVTSPEAQWIGSVRVTGDCTIHTGRWGSQLILTVSFYGRTTTEPIVLRRLGIKIGSANLIALEKRLGKNLMAWPGQSFGLHIASFREHGQRREYLCVDGARQRR